MKRKLLHLVLALVIASTISAVASAQGRGKGAGWGRRSDIFDNLGGRGNGRRRNQDWKCGKFVNCHDARDGRLDGRGPRITRGVFRNGIFVPRATRVRNGIIIRNLNRSRFNRLEMLKQERIAERRHFGNRGRRP